MLLSVHVPKAGGTATADLLQRTFGNRLVRDYDDDPSNPTAMRNVDPHRFFRCPRSVASDVLAVHGHFHPARYADMPNATWVTVLRHPVDTIISTYWYWLSEEPLGPLHAYFLSQALTVEELARIPLLRRLMSETYFGGVDMRQFTLIGRHEDRRQVLQRLANLVGRELPPDERRNVTGPQASLQDMLVDAPLRARLSSLLADDVRFYERWAE